MFIDVHAHLDSKEFRKPVSELIDEARIAGLTTIINCGLNKETNRSTQRLSEKYSIIKPAYGIYPIDAEQMSDSEVNQEIAWIRKQKPIAISEIGLDGKWGKDIEKQIRVFRKMLELAIEMRVPVIVHTRQAEEQCFNVIESTGIKKVVLHCFTGPKELIPRAITNKWSFSIPPVIVHDKSFAELVTQLKLGQLLTETDSPYLAPKRGTQNSPANVVLTIKKMAELKGLNAEEMRNIVFQNYQNLFW